MSEQAPETGPDWSALEVARVDAHVRVLTFRRPERMNALHPPAAAALRSALREAMDDAELRVLVLHGAGDHFCTGFDLKHQRVPGEEGALAILQDCFRLLRSGRLPSVAAVEGNAFGAGLSLALACDQIVAGAGARLCAPFTGIGLVPDVGMVLTLERRVGFGRARRWMYEGTVVDASEAHACGLVDARADSGGALEAAVAQARRWAARAPLAIAALRELSRDADAGINDVLQRERVLQHNLAATKDHAEAVTAFRERRPPQFQGR